jgi:aspartate racemase
MPEKVVGILGGMGPEATVDFFAKVIALTPANRDQDHLRIIIYNNPKIPDRTEAILKEDKSLLPMLVETAKTLERAGVDFIVIPCNTVHYFYEDLRREISIPILHMIREVAYAVKASLPRCKRVGLLATTGTITSNLYQKEFQRVGVEVIVPDTQCQAEVMDAILRIKADHGKERARKELIKAGNLLIKREVKALILGCTDTPLVIKTSDFSVPVFDSNRLLAEATVKFARSETISSRRDT